MTILKTLTDTTFDSVEGYRRAADKAQSPQIKSTLMQQADKRQQLVDQMNAELERRGEELVTKGTTAGKLHQFWVEATNLFESGDEAAVERVEEGEDYLAKKFEEALEMDNLDPQERSLIEIGYAQVKEGERLTDMLDAQVD